MSSSIAIHTKESHVTDLRLQIQNSILSHPLNTENYNLIAAESTSERFLAINDQMYKGEKPFTCIIHRTDESVRHRLLNIHISNLGVGSVYLSSTSPMIDLRLFLGLYLHHGHTVFTVK